MAGWVKRRVCVGTKWKKRTNGENGLDKKGSDLTLTFSLTRRNWNVRKLSRLEVSQLSLPMILRPDAVRGEETQRVLVDGRGQELRERIIDTQGWFLSIAHACPPDTDQERYTNSIVDFLENQIYNQDRHYLTIWIFIFVNGKIKEM